MKYQFIPVVLSLLGSFAEAHSLGESYVFLSIHEDRIVGRIEIPVAHLDAAVGLESNRDGKITEDELNAGLPAVRAYVAERFSLEADRDPLSLTYTSHSVLRVRLAQYAVLNFVVKGLKVMPAGLQVRDALMFDVDSTHRSLLIVEYNQRTGVVNTTEAVSLTFEPGRERQSLDLSYRSEVFRSLAFVGYGLWHVATDPNHVLILAVLFLPSVVVSVTGRWEPVSHPGPVLRNCGLVAVLFGCSHAVGFVAGAWWGTVLPTRLLDWAVVSAIAVTGLYTLLARRNRTVWAAVGFGWLLGLASVPAWAALRPAYGSTLGPFVAINVGIGLGAAVFGAVVVPLLYELRSRALFTRRLLPYALMLLPIIGIARLIHEILETET